MKTKSFELKSNFQPSGDQPNAIADLVMGIREGLAYQTLLGVTGSGKTFTIAQVIQNVQKPTLVLAPNKTLAAQLYGEFKGFFPNNAVEYFVSYYDYYQPEAYVPSSDTFIEKDASINEYIDQMRLSATKSILERQDVIIIATVSAIYGLGEPSSYHDMVLHLQVGNILDRDSIIKRLVEMQYKRNDMDFKRGTFRVKGEIVDVFPADSEKYALRIELFDENIEKLSTFDPITGTVVYKIPRFTIYPKTHYVTPKEKLLVAIDGIKAELNLRLHELKKHNKLLEYQRLEQRTKYDLEMLEEFGYCSGIENYSRHLSSRKEGESPSTLVDYMPKNSLIIIDESHVTIPQLHGMYKGDRSRKNTLVDYGFRLPSALDNRPLRFEEFIEKVTQCIYVSATPGEYELERSGQIIEQVVRPTGLLDPEVEIRPVNTQIDDLFAEITLRIAKKERILVTTLTKRMAEDLTKHLAEYGIKVRYLHSDVDTVERIEIIRDLRLGKFDVLVGINLLREGLDIPEISLVVILDADKEGFLRSERSLIQTMGRAARHLAGKAIMYADNITKSMEKAISETNRRRNKQRLYNEKYNIEPQTIVKSIVDLMELPAKEEKVKKSSNLLNLNVMKMSQTEFSNLIRKMENKMHSYAKNLKFEEASKIRDELIELKKVFNSF